MDLKKKAAKLPKLDPKIIESAQSFEVFMNELKENTQKHGKVNSELSVSDDGRTIRGANSIPMFRSKNARRLDITQKSKFAPRTDFPPSSMLFQAMRKIHGDNWGRHKLPETAAACWALVHDGSVASRVDSRYGVGRISGVFKSYRSLGRLMPA